MLILIVDFPKKNKKEDELLACEYIQNQIQYFVERFEELELDFSNNILFKNYALDVLKEELTAYLQEEFFDEDDNFKQERINEIMDWIKKQDGR
jgi:hypothetical protein